LLANAVCIYQKQASRKLINILSTLGFSDELPKIQKRFLFISEMVIGDPS